MPSHVELPEAREVHAHKRHQRSRVQNLAAPLIPLAARIQRECENKGEKSDQRDVRHGGIAPGIDVRKQLVRQDLVASHAEQDAGRAHLSGEPAAEAGQDQDGPHRMVEERSAHALANVHKCGVAAGEAGSRTGGMIAGPILGPDALREIHLGAAEQRREHDVQPADHGALQGHSHQR